MAVTTASVIGVLSIVPAAALPTWTPSPEIVCVDATGFMVQAHGRIAGCFDLSQADPYLRERFGSTGFANADLGAADAPAPSQCTPGRLSHEDGWVWTCVVESDRHTLVKVKPWRRPAQFAYGHTSTPGRSTVTISANTPLTGCRLSASNKQLLGGKDAVLRGRSGRVALQTSKVPPGTYALRVICKSAPLNASSDLVVRDDGSALLRSDCLDAWHDSKYGDAVPGYGRRMDPALAAATKAACADLAPLTYDEYQRIGQEAYLRIGQIAEREVRRVSAAKGIPICQAIAEVFKPVDTTGRPVAPWPHPYLDAPMPIAGYQRDGYFPALFRQWQDGPVRMDTITNCASGNQALRFAAGTWALCKLDRLALAPADPHQMYPVYVYDRSGCPSDYPVDQVSRSSICVVWGDRIGNNTVGGVGKVFAAAATSVSGDNWNAAMDCQDRALQSGQFTNVDLEFVPTLT